MPTLDEWQNALSVQRLVTVDSTNNLAQRVNQKQGSSSFSGIPKNAQGLPNFSRPRRIYITPAEILQMLGWITTPRIDNLADLSSTWARLRYIWAFAPDANPTNLRLSNEALEIDFHQKGLLSDEIGVGMASLIVERYFNGRNPVDTDIALRNHIIPDLINQYRTSPDYIFENPGGGYLILECKGTQSGTENAMRQLKRGTEQLPSLVFQSGIQTINLVIGTCLSDQETNVYIIDPPGKNSSNKDRPKFNIHDEAKFHVDLNKTQLSQLYLYAGVTTRALETNPDDKTKVRLQKLR